MKEFTTIYFKLLFLYRMKKYLFILLTTIVAFAFSCVKDPDHRVRFSNSTDRVIAITLDDSIRFDSIAPNTKTNYVPVIEGAHNVGGDYQGSFTVEGKGTIKWTVDFNDNKTPPMTLIQE